MPTTKNLEPWVAVTMRFDDPKIEAHAEAALADLKLAGKAFIETMAKVGFRAAVVMDVGRDPR